MSEEIQQDAMQASTCQERNLQKALNEPLHDGIRTDMDQVVLARDLRRGRVLVGGLGPFGVGSMWFKETDSVKSYPGYSSCPIFTKEMEVSNIQKKITRLENEIAKLKEAIANVPD